MALRKNNPPKLSVQELLEKGLTHHRAGDVQHAEHIYGQVLLRTPENATAWYLRSVIAMSEKNYARAAELLERALKCAPENAVFLCNLGEAYRRLDRRSEALAALQRATAANPNLAEAHYNLGVVQKQLGRVNDAIKSFERALALNPKLPRLGEELLNTWSLAGRRDLAIEFYECMRNVVHDELAIAVYERIRNVVPDTAGLRIALADYYFGAFLFDDAVKHFEHALELDSNSAPVHASYASVLADQGDLDAAIHHYRKALELDPNDHISHGNLLFILSHHTSFDGRQILAEAEAFGRQHIKNPPLSVDYPNVRDPTRRLRVGYVSPDFRQHSVAHFLLPLFRHHDRDSIDLLCYSNVSDPDSLTHQFREQADTWREIWELDDQVVANQIRDDRIDILVDVAMHTKNNRLMVFARKPAPVQVAYLAFLGTTGIPTMDYRLTEPRLDPPGNTKELYTERSFWLPDVYWCYDPLTTVPEVNALPAVSAGFITFGSLNNFRKVSPEALALWVSVLQAVPRSRMIIHAPPGATVERVRVAFESQGVNRDRLDFVGRLSREAYLETYQRIDVCLDTVPHNGATTSLDAYWMGVPVVSLLGPTVVGRGGYTIAHHLGLPDLVATSADEYVACAARLAADLGRLSELRAQLRSRLEQSALMDAPKFARAIEQAYRTMWTEWCRGGPD